MPATRLRTSVALGVSGLSALLVLSACSSTTKGSGDAVGPRSTAQSTPSKTAATSATSTAAAPTTRSSSSAVVIPAPSKPLRSASVPDPDGSQTYKIDVWAERADEKCSAHAYGAPVIQYLIAHPCRGMSRLIATTAVNGKRVGFSQITIAFLGGPPASYEYAGNFRTLVLKDGTGSVNDLLREGYRLPAGPTAIPSDEAFTATGQDAVTTIYDAWYLDQPTPNNDPALIKMLTAIFLQF